METKQIPGFENYVISTNGTIINTITNKSLKPIDNSRGYLKVVLFNDGFHKTFRVHRLVAEMFIPNPHNYPVVNHKDLNKNNNDVSNLEWCSFSYNSLHSSSNQINQHHKPVALVQGKRKRDEHPVKVYLSIREAAKDNNICYRSLVSAMQQQQLIQGLKFKYCEITIK